MGIASFVIGFVTLIGACVNLIPGLAWGNYLLIPIGLVGDALGIASLLQKNENKAFAIIGLALNLLALGIAITRLLLSIAAGGFGIL